MNPGAFHDTSAPAAPSLPPSPAPRAPRATYRLQFHKAFTLPHALELVPYLHDLGVSHVYASPLLKARPGSTHGYDVTDPTQLNPELGSERDLRALIGALHAHGMGLILDIVPNHMAINEPGNRWWWDLLRHGRASRFAAWFDIDWESPDPDLHGRILVPVLGHPYPEVLQRGELTLAADSAGAILRYFDHSFPLDPASLPHGGLSVDALAHLNSDRGALDRLVQRQHYRLAHWQEGDSRLNYRRFFSITHLAGIRIELPEVFTATHERILAWYRDGLIDGLRIDHPDGLRDPWLYLQRLHQTAPDAWITVEKILEPGEDLPPDWPVAGTTGYDFIQNLGSLFIDPAGCEPLTGFYARFTGEPTDFAEIVREKKRLVLRELLIAEVSRLTALLGQLQTRASLPLSFQPEDIRMALVEWIACFPVYRTYVRADAGSLSEPDRFRVRQASEAARAIQPRLAPLFDLLEHLLLLGSPEPVAVDFVMRFQQLSGPAMAKGLEDTAFYCFNRFIALNEVGGDPADFGAGPDAFHEACRKTRANWPRTMLATSTHDTKRSEDVRARLYALSEIPSEWAEAVQRWSALNERHRTGPHPDRNAEYLLYQTLAGAWPISTTRAVDYMEKAAREARQHTTWTQPDAAFEDALKRFVTAILEEPEFTQDLERFVQPLVEAGYLNSLAQTLIKLTAPGVPDLYQGTELWDFSLVDPDNRRAVDFQQRQCLMRAMEAMNPEAIWHRRPEGLPKLWLIRNVLALRARAPALFDGAASHRPLKAGGSKAHHVVAFERAGALISIVPRLVLKLSGDWADTRLTLPAGTWLNAFTGETWPAGPASLAALTRRFPIALLQKSE
jgi:(1->4)-alpha-D-glucan 1-alpha-D-glucosylmutase